MPRFPVILARSGLVVLMAMAGVQAVRADATLRWSLRRGETLRYALNQVADVTIDAPGQKITLKTELTVELTWVVRSIASNGTIELAQTVDRAISKSIANGKSTLTYDTKDKKGADIPEVEPVAKLYEALLGQSYVIRLSPQGEVLEVVVPEAITKALEGSPFAATADSGSFFSPAGVRTFLTQVMPGLPREPIAPGATWTREITPRGDSLKMSVKTTYTLADLTSPARIDAKIATTLTSSPESKMAVTLTKQAAAASFRFDAAAGRLVESSTRQSYDLTVADSNGDVVRSIKLAGSFRLLK